MSDQQQGDFGSEQFSGPAEGEGFYDAYEPQYQQYDDELQAANARADALQGALAEREAEALTSDYPELAEQSAAYELVAQAARIAEHLGAPELADDPRFWRRIHEASVQAAGAAGGYARRGDDADAIISGSADGNPPLGRRCLPFAWEGPHDWTDGRCHDHNRL